MSIVALNGASLTISPTSIRYSMAVNSIDGALSGKLYLQRSEHKADGTWLDDPTPSSKKTISLVTGDALNTLLALMPSVLSAIGFSDAYTDYRLQAIGRLSSTGVLDVLLIFQLKTNDGWVAKSVPSLSAFLAVNATLATDLNAAWDAYDAAVSAANTSNAWL